jgi:hypothetical protein
MARRARAAAEDASLDPGAEPTLEGAFAPDGVDLTAIRWTLERTPTERLQAAQDLIDAVWALRGVEQD